MTVPRHCALSPFSQDIATNTLYEQAIAVVHANQDASCAGLQRHLRIGYDLALQLQKRLEDNGALQEIDSYVEPKKVFVRVVDLAGSPTHALVELVACDASENQRLAATSTPMPRDAAQAIARLYDKKNGMPPAFQSLRAVLSKTGPTAWATAASSASNAAEIASLEVCAYIKGQTINLNTARGALVVTTLTSDCKFVSVIKTVLDTIGAELPSNASIATAVVIDDTISGLVQVQLLASGVQHDNG